MDGTGKTTHASNLYELLVRKRVRCTYIHPYFEHGIVLRRLLSLFSEPADKMRHELVSQAQKRQKTCEHGKLRSIILKLWALLVLFDNLVTYFTNFRTKVKESVVISDRYFYDHVIAFYNSGIISRHVANLYLKLLPKPTMTFFFDAPVEVAHQRSGEHSLIFYRKLRNAYLSLSESLKPPPAIIDTTKDFSETSSEILGRFMRQLG